jgi:hypothetical protein
LEVTRASFYNDDKKNYISFESPNMYRVSVNDKDTFYFPDDLKKLANDGMPKQGETVQVKFPGSDDWTDAIFVSMFK